MTNKNTTNKKEEIHWEEAAEILDISDIPYLHIQLAYLIDTVPLTEIKKDELYLYKDELLNLLDSTHPSLQKVRKNKGASENELLKSVAEMQLRDL